MSDQKKPLVLIVCGHGALAQALWSLHNSESVIVIKFENGLRFDPRLKECRLVAIHAGSGRQLEPLLHFCLHSYIPLIQASTGIALPVGFAVPIINAPNLALTIISFMDALPHFIKTMATIRGVQIAEVGLKESHQSTKTTVPGTARVIARNIGLPEEKIVSIRKPAEQILMGVPEEHLGRHAYHIVDLKFADGIVISVASKVHGLEPYGAGGLTLAQIIGDKNGSHRPLEPILHTTSDFIGI